MGARIKRKLPDAPPPTKARYKRPVDINGKYITILPTVYNPRPAPIPKAKPKPKANKPKEVKPPMPRPTFWTPERVATLTEMYKAGYKYDDIAKALGRKRTCICEEVRRLLDKGVINARVNPRGWTDEDLALMKKMRAEGKTFGEIGDKVGRTAKTCSEMYRRVFVNG